MNRRRFLRVAAVGAGLVAGCVSDGPGAPGPTTTEAVETTETTSTHLPSTRTEPPTTTTTRIPADETTTRTPSGERITETTESTTSTRAPSTRTESESTTTPSPANRSTIGPTTTPSEMTTTARAEEGTPTATTQRPTWTHRPTGTGDAEADIQRRVSLASVDDVADGHQLTIETELFDPTITPAHTARVQVTTTDHSGRRRQISAGGTGGCSLFNRGKGQSDPAGLWLHDPDSADYIDRAGERWSADRDPDEPRGVAAYGCGFAPTVHDEPITSRYLVWDDYRVEGYMKPDTYRFEVSVSVGGGDSYNPATHDTTAGTAQPESTFTWGFDLAVEKP